MNKIIKIKEVGKEKIARLPIKIFEKDESKHSHFDK